MTWGGHGLPKVSLGPAMPYPSTSCGRETPEKALWPFQGWAGQHAAVFYPLGHPTPYGVRLCIYTLTFQAPSSFVFDVGSGTFARSAPTCGPRPRWGFPRS
jgi:hypothetical protein